MREAWRAGLSGWAMVRVGKTWEIYRPVGLGRTGDHLLMVSTDRLAVFDRVVPSLIPDKGEITTQISLWWLKQLSGLVTTHLASVDVPEAVAGRAIMARALRMIPFQCQVMGYMNQGAMWEYREAGTVGGQALPGGLHPSERLPESLFIPARKGRPGTPDVPVSERTFADAVGAGTAAALRDSSLRLYRRAHEIAASHGLVLADTKFEFGVNEEVGDIELGDEVMTPDSSHFWLASEYWPGTPQRSFDKELVGKWLMEQPEWDTGSFTQPPPLPTSVVALTRERYVTVYHMLTGCPWQPRRAR